MIYCKNTYFGFRNVHPNDTICEYLKRIDPNLTVDENIGYQESHRPMVEHVLSIYLNHVGSTGSTASKREIFHQLLEYLVEKYGTSDNISRFIPKTASSYVRRMIPYLRNLRKRVFQITQTENKIRIKIFGSSISFKRSAKKH